MNSAERAPQRQDRAARAVLRMHAGAAQLDHALAQRLQARQVELACRCTGRRRACALTGVSTR